MSVYNALISGEKSTLLFLVLTGLFVLFLLSSMMIILRRDQKLRLEINSRERAKKNMHTSSHKEVQASPDQEQLQTLFDNSPVGVGIFVDEVMRYANPRILSMMNLKVGESPRDAYVNQAAYLKSIEQIHHLNVVPEVAVQTFDARGHIHDLLITYSCTTYEGRQGVLAWAIDVTQCKNYEKQLAMVKEKAESATRAKSEFLANTSHEIRTPMNAIMGMTHLLQQTALSPNQKSYLTKIDYSVQELLRIIDDILDFSNIESGKTELEHVDFALDTVFEYLSSLHGAMAESKGIQLFFHIPPQVPAILKGDPGRLGQILSNLLSNAIKFTQQGAVEISVKADIAPQNKTSGQSLAGVPQPSPSNTATVLHFEVKDTGIGMSPQQRDRLFHPFTQADASTTRHYGGTGLGLVICKRLIEMLGGKIKLESTLGKGSLFSFSALFQYVEGATRPYLNLPSARVLVVDGNAMSRHLLIKTLMENAPANVVLADEAQNAPDAVELILGAFEARLPYEYALIDRKLPDMGGIACAKRIRERCAAFALAHPDLDCPVPCLILMATSHNRDEVLNLAAEQQISWLLSKPVIPSELLQALEGSPLSPEPRMLPSSMEILTPLNDSRQILLAEDNGINQELSGALNDWSNFPDWPDLPGIDILKGFNRVSGNKNLYRRLLVDFAKRYLSQVESIKQAFAKADMKGTRELIRHLKAISGNIGAIRLHHVAHAIECDLKANDMSEAQKRLSQLVSALDEVLMGLQVLQESATSESATGESAGTPSLHIDRADLVQALKQTASNLNLGSPEAQASFAPVEKNLRKLYPAEVEFLLQSMDHFDFSAGLDIVRKLANRLDITLE